MNTDQDRPKFKRKVTEFLCREMLYDYLTGRLKEPRRSDIENFLSNHEDLKKEKDLLKNGLDYIDRLKGVEVTDELTDHLQKSLSIWNYLSKVIRPKTWPEWLLLGLEGVAIAGFAFLFITYTPWYDVREWWDSNTSIKKFVTQDKPTTSFNPLDQLEDQVETEVAESTNSQNDSIERDANVKASEVANNNIDSKPVGAPQVTKTKNTEVAKVVEKPTATATPAKRLAGSVTKIFMGLSNLDARSKSIVEFIENLGGSKAGEVPLGWRRPKGSYFNLRMPEAKFDDLLKFLKDFGEVKVEKEPHRIVMNEGEMRVVMWIQALPSKAKSEPEISNKKQPESVSPPSSVNQLDSANGKSETVPQSPTPKSSSNPEVEDAAVPVNSPATPEGADQ